MQGTLWCILGKFERRMHGINPPWCFSNEGVVVAPLFLRKLMWIICKYETS